MFRTLAIAAVLSLGSLPALALPAASAPASASTLGTGSPDTVVLAKRGRGADDGAGHVRGGKGKDGGRGYGVGSCGGRGGGRRGDECEEASIDGVSGGGRELLVEDGARE